MEQLPLFQPGAPPVIVAAGLGVDSTAMLCGLVRRGERPDGILFADTGGEKRVTYEYLPILQEFLAREGFPPVVVVRYTARDFKNWPPYHTLEENCLTNGTLPGISFGPASCSVKWKQSPQHAWIKGLASAQRAWKDGQRVVKLIGFDAGPTDRRRTYAADPKDAHRYEYRMPLQAWGWDRAECQRQIAACGLPVPEKSACFFCLAMKPWEVSALQPDMLRRIVRMEARAQPRLRTVEGLWRSTVKGTRGGTPRPGSMTAFILEQRLLPAEEVQHLRENTPTAITAYLEGYARAKAQGTLAEFSQANPITDPTTTPYETHKGGSNQACHCSATVARPQAIGPG